MNANQPSGNRGLRHARMPMRTAVLMVRGVDFWSSEVEDISATGVLLYRPEGWCGNIGEIFVLDILINDELNIHLEAEVVRITDQHLGFAYACIPADKEIPLWNLLGGYADQIESIPDHPD